MIDLGIHIVPGGILLELLRRVEAGERADDVYLEAFAGSEHVPNDEEGERGL